MKIKRNSWLYKLAVGRRSSIKEWGADNVCAVMRAILWRSLGYTLGVAIVVAAAAFVLFITADIIAWFAAMAVMGAFIDPGPGGTLLLIVAGVGSLVGVVALTIYGVSSAAKRASQAAAATAVFGGVTGKFCTRVEFVD